MANLRETYALEFSDYEKFYATLQRVGRQAGLLDTEIEQLTSSIDKAGQSTLPVRSNMQQLGGVIKGVGATIVSSFTIGTIVAFGKEVAETRKRLEQLENAIRVASGNAGEYRKNLDFLRNITAELGLDAESAAQGFKTLLGSLQGTNLTSRQARDIFRQVSTAVSAMGLSGEDANGVFLAFGQILSKGKVSSEELRGQIGERLPGAFAIAARSLGVTMQELDKMLEQGELISEEFLPKFAAELERTFGQGVKIDGLTQSVNRADLKSC